MKRETGAFNAKENQIVISPNDIMKKIVLMHSFIHFTVHIYIFYCYCIHLLYCSLKKNPFWECSIKLLLRRDIQTSLNKQMITEFCTPAELKLCRLNASWMEINYYFQRTVGGQCSQDKRSRAKGKGALIL